MWHKLVTNPQVGIADATTIIAYTTTSSLVRSAQALNAIFNKGLTKPTSSRKTIIAPAAR